ncbi:pirin family protein [Crenobacter sp. SG2305]|uniref:pirin family protein n=1 Tax=Crenobacter oryzisoli TaxID=3056844 RepID=UPI0025AAE7DE|nr:pirin family protein [Crenobacter sp. SG2305]MDN0084828.1 pirin family protein [Crenobacter sp. SG2305]
MTAIRLLIEPKVHDIGFPVRRLLPVLETRSIGPFVFFDHMGPADFEPNTTEGDVRPHPHIGLATVTYLFSGALVHRDSLGTVQRIEPGAINLMTAGRGIVHSERIPPDIRANETVVQGIQTWIALPVVYENVEPDFQHYTAEQLPGYQEDGVQLRVLIGRMGGLTSPVHTYSPTLYATAILDEDATLELDADYQEQGLYVVSGAVSVNGEPIKAGQLAQFEPGQALTLTAQANSRVMLLGGAPLDGRRHMYWNFVASSRERIEEAKADWAAGRFAPVPGESEFIPLPG